MAKYRSLLFKEMKLSVRHYGFMALMIIMLIAIACLGLFVNMEELPEEIIVLAYFMVNIIAVISGCAFSWETDVDRIDKTSGFSVYVMTLPVKALDRAIVSYFVRIMAIIAGFIFAVIGKVLIGIIANAALDNSFCFAYFLVVCIGLFLSVCLKGTAIFIKTTDKAEKILAIAVFIVLVVVLFIGLGRGINLKVMFDDNGLGIPTIVNQVVSNGVAKYGMAVFLSFILLTGCGMFLAVKTYGRREA